MVSVRPNDKEIPNSLSNGFRYPLLLTQLCGYTTVYVVTPLCMWLLLVFPDSKSQIVRRTEITMELFNCMQIQMTQLPIRVNCILSTEIDRCLFFSQYI